MLCGLDVLIAQSIPDWSERNRTSPSECTHVLTSLAADGQTEVRKIIVKQLNQTNNYEGYLSFCLDFGIVNPFEWL